MFSVQKDVAKRRLIDKAGSLYAQSLRKTQHFSAEQIRAFQENLLYTTYRDAIRRVPYYKERGQEYPKLAQESFLKHFATLPVLDKATVKQETADFIRRPRSPFLLRLTTSGTTGSPLEILQSPLGRVKSNALRQSVYEMFCGLKSPRRLELSASLSAHQSTLQLPGTRTAYVSIFHLNEEHRSHFVELLKDFQPEIIQGYPSALSQLARLFPKGLPYKLSDNTVRCVSTSETLFPNTRKFITENLGVIVHNEYGSQEGQHFVFECAHGGMHIHPARGYLEILEFDSDQPAAPGQTGRIVVTGFQNPHMPLLRYSIGDTASMSPRGHRCACGSEWPVLQSLEGRTQDLVRTRDGNRIGLIESATLRTISGITESQVIQTGYEAFTYRIVASAEFDAPTAESTIVRLLSERLGYNVKVNFDYVENIEKTSSGKHRAVIVDFNLAE